MLYFAQKTRDTILSTIAWGRGFGSIKLLIYSTCIIDTFSWTFSPCDVSSTCFHQRLDLSAILESFRFENEDEDKDENEDQGQLLLSVCMLKSVTVMA